MGMTEAEISVGLIAARVGMTGVAGAAAGEHAASSNITLQLKTTIRLNMVILLRYIN
jgi:hypothetical protein